MKIVSFDQITSLNISPYTCYAWVSEGIRRKHEALLPAKISLKPGIPGVFYNTMPSILPFAGYAGVKLVTRYPERAPSLDSEILLYDLESGKNLALLDGNWITTMRTGAVAAHSVRLLAKRDFSTIGMIGLGNTARAAFLVLLSLYPERQFTVKLKRYKDQHELFAARFAAYANVKFVYCDSYEELVRGSEVVLSAVTMFEDDICPDDCFEEGVLLVPIHTRGFTNCDLFFEKVFADDVNHVKGFKNFGKFRSFAEVSDVVNGKVPGRTDDRERILAYNIGISLHDIYFAGKIYELLAAHCPEADLRAPTEKFWI